MIELQKSSLVFLQSHRAQVRWVLRYRITACSSRTKKSMSVLGDFRQFFNAYLDRVTVSATGRLLQSSWHCWTATGWGTLMPLPETATSKWVPEQEVDRQLWFNSSWQLSHAAAHAAGVMGERIGRVKMGKPMY